MQVILNIYKTIFSTKSSVKIYKISLSLFTFCQSLLFYDDDWVIAKNNYFSIFFFYPYIYSFIMSLLSIPPLIY